MQTKISEIQVRLMKGADGFLGFGSCLIDDKWAVSNLGIYTRREGDGFRITYPTKLLKNGQSIRLFYPIAHEVGEVVERAFTDAVNNLLS